MLASKLFYIEGWDTYGTRRSLIVLGHWPFCHQVEMAGLLPWTSYLVSAWELNVKSAVRNMGYQPVKQTWFFWGSEFSDEKICLDYFLDFEIIWSDRHFIHLRFSASEMNVLGTKKGQKELIDLFDPSHGEKFTNHFSTLLSIHFRSICYRNSHQLGTPNFTLKFRFPKNPMRFFWILSYLSSEMPPLFFWSKVSARYPAGAGLYPRTKLEVLP